MRTHFLGPNGPRDEGEEPFRSELYSPDQMDQHAESVALSHRLTTKKTANPLLKRLGDNEATLLEARKLLIESLRAGKTVTPAGEWLLDNFYLIEEQILIARKHLPKGYSEGLPYLANGTSSGLPRVYDIVVEIIAHSDGRVDTANLASFVSAYQKHTVLTLGELWAIPIMLRLAVIENLRRISRVISLHRIDQNLSDYWADQMIQTVKKDPGDLILTIADMARTKPNLSGAFVAGLVRHLQGKGPALALPLSWMEQQLSRLGANPVELVKQETKKQASSQVSVRNSIGTLRVLGATDWQEFVEAQSRVEQILGRDPSGTYSAMDFATRDQYRHRVESLSKASKRPETEVAELVVALALAATNTAEKDSPKKHGHVGYFLIDQGLKQTGRSLAIHFSPGEHVARLATRSRLFLFLGSIAFLTLAVAAAMILVAYRYGTHHWLLLIPLGLLSLSAAAQLSISTVNWLSTLLVKPEFLPRMDFSQGIPPQCRTLVAVPTMLTTEAYLEEMIDALEVRYLSNREELLHYGLLTDFADADSETLPGDHGLLESAARQITALNEKYPRTDGGPFFLFHRPRVWNPEAGQWMGRERKRGKLADLNALIRGRGDGRFSLVLGLTTAMATAKYVITLDSDTKLPREAAWKIIATMAHPLNQAVFDPQKGRVTQGYGILQPRVASSLPEGGSSLYLRMQGSAVGIDPYTRASSDVYQDVFGEGSFIGKGIYDLDVFETCLNGVFLENRILSHDLLEGCYARSGLLSDVSLYEDNPREYGPDVKRRYRWTRGDWQIAAWIWPWTRNSQGRTVKNALSGLSRWKIFDNLRRTVVPVSLLSLLILGWAALPLPLFWTFLVAGLLLFPVVTASLWQLISKPAELPFRAHLAEVIRTTRDDLLRFLYSLAVLPHEAYEYSDAVVRTLWRMLVTKKRLLEWTTSVSTTRTAPHDLPSAFASMKMAPLLALVCVVLFSVFKPLALTVAWPFLFLWFAAPAVAWRLGLPESLPSLDLSDESMGFLRKQSLKIWTFFETYVTEGDHWLPPDNVQDLPILTVAHRTSPTNMGLSLLSNLAAADFSYITGQEMVLRCEKALGTMAKMERFKGHFFNWYDTLSLEPLRPRYVSTVDTGNLIGHILTLRQGLLGLAHQPIVPATLFEGLATTVRMVQSHSKRNGAKALEKILEVVTSAQAEPKPLIEIQATLADLRVLVADWAQTILPTSPASAWASRLSVQLAAFHDDLQVLCPWLHTPDKIFASLATRLVIPSLSDLADLGSTVAVDRLAQLDQLAAVCEQLCIVDYGFLFSPETRLLRIGYSVDDQRKDRSSYDLLASEARLAVFVAIAQGKIPQDGWFALGRLLTTSGGDPILLSWSGSMFEYLMPELVMPSYENTLLPETNRAVVKRQIEYGAQRGVPWGISESAYNMVDANLNYQYRAFGVPGLGLKRGLEVDLVVAPYATMLALMIWPSKACQNLQTMASAGFEGEFGFYEAVDFTPSRLPRGNTNVVIQSYMVHHQGMSLLALAKVLLDAPMQKRFTADLRFRSALLLLQERIPRATVFQAHTADPARPPPADATVPVRSITTPFTPVPEIQLLSNGRYQVMVTNSGGGYSRWKDLAVTRWREDTTKDDSGIFCYIKDLATGRFWSNTHQPTKSPAKSYEARFSQGHVEFHRHDYRVETTTEIVVSPEDDTEMRRITLTNRSASVKYLELTSYAEIVLASQASDEAHPAFSNLFVQTEIQKEFQAILCTRRPRSADKTEPWMFHLMDAHDAEPTAVSYETDRAQFLGRDRSLVHPQALDQAVLSGHQGGVLDPIVSIRQRIALRPGQSARIDLIFGVAETKEACEALMQKYRDEHQKSRALELSWTHSQVLMRQLDATEADAQMFNKLAASVVFANRRLRADPLLIQSNHRGQSGLWSHSISGDLPIVLLHVYSLESLEIVRQLVQAHAYWSLKGLEVDLVIWNEDLGSYRQDQQEKILGLVGGLTDGRQVFSKPGQIFVKSAEQLSAEDRVLIESVARVVLSDQKGSLVDQINRVSFEIFLPPFLDVKPGAFRNEAAMVLPPGLLFLNGLGGFSPDGREYVILTDQHHRTPAPWSNVIANPNFGTVISESGSAYTWAVNAHEYRLTPWNNDPITDAGGEAFYLRDEDSGAVWSPSPFPKAGESPYLVTHGFGYSTFEHREQGLATKMTVSVDQNLPVKFMVLTVSNHSGKDRRLSITGYLETILGDLKSRTGMHIVSEWDAESQAWLIRNPYNSAFADRVTFFRVQGTHQSFTADRTEFIGRNRSLEDPIALSRKGLSGRTGAGYDPCAALQVTFDLHAGAEKEIVFQLGNEENTAATLALMNTLDERNAAADSLGQVKQFWISLLDTLQITTPDPAVNLLANGWLTYQTISARLFARSGFYQSGGAFGFRDQLQDVLALIPTRPDLVKQQILLSASREFAEGDVQHWWHPPEGRGVRTRCSDDLLWLPFVVCRYLETTGDTDILTASLGFLEGRSLAPDEDSLYDLPVTGNLKGTLYEHCVRVLRLTQKRGIHGLPLMGSGDWNDGMDRVGHLGQGESVWLGFFLYDILVRFATVARDHGETSFAASCTGEAGRLQEALEAHGWDGEWYRRAYYDDGTILGSQGDAECQIDAIAQSWSVLSGEAPEARRLQAMTALDEHLVRRDLRLIQLLEPPFDTASHDPGYIKGYPPGVRENGGQYTHAAVWTLMAFAALGDRQKTWELFNLVQPISHSSTPQSLEVYRVEPYVMAADVYASRSHPGRGGWTWYTGSAGWMQQFLVGSLVGLEFRAGQLLCKPCFPLEWPSVSVVYHRGQSTYHVTVFQFQGDSGSWWKTGDLRAEGNQFPLIDDGQVHEVEVHVQV